MEAEAKFFLRSENMERAAPHPHPTGRKALPGQLGNELILSYETILHTPVCVFILCEARQPFGNIALYRGQ